jgi:hypothetical protein
MAMNIYKNVVSEQYIPSSSKVHDEVTVLDSSWCPLVNFPILHMLWHINWLNISLVYWQTGLVNQRRT